MRHRLGMRRFGPALLLCVTLCLSTSAQGDAISRAFSVFAGGLSLPPVTTAESRPFSVFAGGLSLPPVTSAESRPFSVFAGSTGAPNVTDAVSRSFSVFAGETSAPQTTDAVSRPFSVFAGRADLPPITDAVARPISVYVPAPDLDASAFDVPQNWVAGLPGTVSWTVTNLGDADAPGWWQDRVYLSTNPYWDASDRILYSQDHNALLSGQPYSEQVQVRIPLDMAVPPGTYYLIFRADVGGRVAELDEDNNFRVSPAVELVRENLPDLVVSQVVAPPGAAAGAPVTLNWAVKNTGKSAVAPPWSERVYASSDSQIGNDTLLLSRTFSEPLGVDQEVARSAQLNLPNLPGNTWYLIVVLDTLSQVVEADETNNTGVSGAATITRADLAVTDVAAPSAVTGDESFTVTYTVGNAGEAVAPASWVDRVYLTATPGETGTLLGDAVRSVSLEANGTYTNQISVKAPGRLANGTYWVYVQANATSTVPEQGDAANNVRYAPAPTTLTQPERPNLVPLSVDVPEGGLIGQSFSFTYRVANVGEVDASGSWTDRVVAVTDTGHTYPLQDLFVTATVVVGDSYSRTIQAAYPPEEGTYRILVTVDRTDALNEGVEGGEGDNTLQSTGTFTVGTYAVTVAADLEQAVSGTPVTLTGTATVSGTGQPLANIAVEVGIAVQGTTRTLAATTDTSGAYSLTFEPLPTEAGRYSLTAGPPGARGTVEQDSFVLHGMHADPRELRVTAWPGLAAATAVVNVMNDGDTPLNGLKATFEGLPAGIQPSAAFDAGSLGPRATAKVQLQLGAAEGTPVGDSTGSIRFSSNQGAVAVVPIAVSVRPAEAKLVALPATLHSAMLRSTATENHQTLYSFKIVNTGAGASGSLEILLPQQDWMTLASPAKIDPLQPGQETQVDLLLSPAAALPLGPYSGNLVIAGWQNGLAVPFTFTNVSDSKGSLLVTATDEATYWAEGSPKVPGATVKLLDPYTKAEIQSVTTDAQGLARFPELNEGPYRVEVSAPEHGAFSTTIQVKAAEDTNVEAFLPMETVRYEWTVVPTTIEDEYRISIQAVYETNVPAPVIVLEPATLDLAKLSEGKSQFDLRISNKGLIAAQNVSIAVGNTDEWNLTPLTASLGDLGPASSVTVPFTVVRTASAPSTKALKASSTCTSPSVGVKHELTCGGQRDYWTHLGILNSGMRCHSSAAGGSQTTTGGAGGASPSVTLPTVYETPQFCNSCTYKCFPACALNVLPGICILGSMYGCSTGMSCSANDCLLAQAQFDCIIGFITCIADFTVIGYPVTFPYDAGACICSLWRDCMPCIAPGLAAPADTRCTLGDFVYRPRSGLQTGSSSKAALDTRDRFYLDGVVAHQAAVRAFYGNDKWLSIGKESLPALRIWLQAFREAVDTDSESGHKISSQEQGRLTTTDYPVDLSPADVEKLVIRWNRTVEYDSLGIRSIEQLPEGFDPDFIDGPSVVDQMNIALKAHRTAIEDGYSDAIDAAKHFLSIAQGHILQTEGQDGVCARVKIQIDQRAVLTRSAFEATLKVENTGTEAPIQNLAVDVLFRDANGQPANERFTLLPPTLTGLSDVSGSGYVSPGASGEAKWLIVPNADAAPTEPQRYYVSGEMRYILNGRESKIPLFPVEITVYPDPKLHLKYFLEQDVYSDDPFTPEIEPAIPFSLGLLVTNSGAGTAHNLRIASGQPRIVENDKGLLIGFQILGSQINGEPASPSLKAEFGDIAPGETSFARWLMTSTLQGRFISFDAQLEHVTDLGEKVASLIDDVEIHPMSHVVMATGALNDDRPDFLANDIPDAHNFPDTLHTSNGLVLPVALVADAVADGTATADHPTVQVRLTSPGGWFYTEIEDPCVDGLELAMVQRSDGKPVLVGSSAWQTRKVDRPQGDSPTLVRRFHLFDYGAQAGTPFSYTLTYVGAAPRPLITLLGESTIEILQHETYTDPGATVSDAGEGDITARLQVYNPVDTEVPGTYLVVYNATNGAGVAAVQQVRVVHVLPVDQETPILSVQTTTVEMDPDGGDSTLGVLNSGAGQMAWSAQLVDAPDWLIVLPPASGINAGTVTLRAQANTTQATRTATLRITAPEAVPGFIDVTVTQATSLTNTITGVVRDAATEQPIACAAVAAGAPDAADVQVFSTDMNGVYTATGLKGGAYRVDVFAPGYVPQSQDLNLGVGETGTLDFSLSPAADATGVAGTVVDSARDNAPLGGVRVDAFQGTVLVATVYSCADGRFEITGLTAKAASVALTFSLENYDNASQDVPLTAGQVVNVVVPMSPATTGTASITGIVRAAGTGQPLPDARISLTGAAAVSAYADPAGNYVVADLPPGFYELRASAPGFIGQTAAIELEADELQSQTFALESFLRRHCDINKDGPLNALDVQLVINAVLGRPVGAYSADVNTDRQLNASDVQTVINAVLGRL